VQVSTNLLRLPTFLLFQAVAVLSEETNTRVLEAFVRYLFLAVGYRNTLETFSHGYLCDLEVACRLFAAHQDGIDVDLKWRMVFHGIADRVFDSENLRDECKMSTLTDNSGPLDLRAAPFDTHSQLSLKQPRVEEAGDRVKNTTNSTLVCTDVRDEELDDRSNVNIGLNLSQEQKLREKLEEVRKETECWKNMFKNQKENAQSWRKSWSDQRISHNSAMSGLLEKQSELLEEATPWKRKSEEN
jgi:hypothetical protein